VVSGQLMNYMCITSECLGTKCELKVKAYLADLQMDHMEYKSIGIF